jgi:hypothetical protein
LRKDAESSLVAMIASILEINQRVIQLCCRCAAEVNTSFNGQPSERSSTPAIISLLRRACQIRGRRCRRSLTSPRNPIASMPSGRLGPSQAARNSFASFGATMRLVAVTPE